MSFTFPALILFILSLPGILFRFGYKSGLKERDITFGKLPEETAWGIAVAAIIHLFVIQLLPIIPGALPADIPTILNLLGAGSDGMGHSALKNISCHYVRIPLYLLATTVLGLVFGRLLSELFKRNYYDLLFPLLRVESTWHYLFNGQSVMLHRLRDSGKKVTSANLKEYLKDKKIVCMVSALVNTPTSERIIKGIYLDHRLNPAGRLDRITLTVTSRMVVSGEPVDLINPEPNKANPKLNFVEMQGDRFVLSYEKVQNMDLKFYFVKFQA